MIQMPDELKIKHKTWIFKNAYFNYLFKMHKVGHKKYPAAFVNDNQINNTSNISLRGLKVRQTLRTPLQIYPLEKNLIPSLSGWSSKKFLSGMIITPVTKTLQNHNVKQLISWEMIST